ncbi:hypothetical protein [Parasphingopyxis marina]|uniref:DUF937 domain-containing protein n=1 Tax=Parasphingopyxis marina TaxID=2761622 RepID=A0A842HY96_9SPHN|nr:hypothetical protein [Parasphingopyxis marina]MBC2777902.1 hypothetical protein [Parasphingopyxis marina]
MGILDGLLNQSGGGLDLDDLAGKVGLSADQLRTGADSILGRLAGTGTDDPDVAASEAAAETGLPLDRLQELLPQLTQHLGMGEGGDGASGGIGGLVEQAKGFLDRDGDGNPLDDIADMAKGLFNRD